MSYTHHQQGIQQDFRFLTSHTPHSTFSRDKQTRIRKLCSESGTVTADYIHTTVRKWLAGASIGEPGIVLSLWSDNERENQNGTCAALWNEDLI